MELKPEDEKLIILIRSIKYGEIKVKLRDGKPVLVEEGIKTIKLEGVL